MLWNGNMFPLYLPQKYYVALDLTSKPETCYPQTEKGEIFAEIQRVIIFMNNNNNNNINSWHGFFWTIKASASISANFDITLKSKWYCIPGCIKKMKVRNIIAMRTESYLSMNVLVLPMQYVFYQAALFPPQPLTWTWMTWPMPICPTTSGVNGPMEQPYSHSQ